MKIAYKLLLTCFLLSIQAANINAANSADANYKQCFKLIKQQQWSDAEKIAKISSDSALQKIVISEKFLDKNYKNKSFEGITKFIENNPGWSREYSLKKMAEDCLDKNTNYKEIYKWFSKNKPITGNGYKYYALSAAKLHSEPINSSIIVIIKDGWRYGDFSEQEANSYYNKFKKYLTLQDHIARIDYLLMSSNVTAAKKYFYLVNDSYKNSFKAQIALIQKKQDAYSQFKEVPKQYYTNGLIYRYLQSIKKDLPKVNESIDLIKYLDDAQIYADKFYDVQNYMAREYLEKKDYLSAYKIISNHFTDLPSKASNAEFLSGWIALRFLGKPQLAIKHFEKFDRVVSTPVSKSRGLYWLARTYDSIGQTDKALELYSQASFNYPYTFYGQASIIELGDHQLKLPDNIDTSKFSNSKIIVNDDLFKAAVLVAKYGTTSMNQLYLKAAIARAKNKVEVMALAAEIDKIQNVHYKVWFAKQANAKHIFFRDMNYPVPYNLHDFSPGLPVEKALIYSIIRQESVFDQYAVSCAKAYGLMQMIQSTACSTAKSIQMQCSISDLTKDAKYNIQLGSNHLRGLIEDYNKSYILTAVAYNAGPHRVDKWLMTFGDIYKLKHHHDVIDWIELIPFEETRDYVQRVLENVQVYRSILNKTETKFRLKEDLLH